MEKKENLNPEEALKKAIKEIEGQFGQGSIMKLGDRVKVSVDTISTGSLLLDHALGVGGYPIGRIIEIYGPESSGKTTLALHAIAECQKRGGTAAYIDAEHAIDPVYAANLGVKVNDLILSQPSSGEEGLDIADRLIKSHAIELLVIDSVPALVPTEELNGDMDDAQIGLQARMMSKALRKITANLNQNKCSIIFINQLREKIGIMFGNPEVTPGGRALKFYSTIRLEVRRGEINKDASSGAIGNEVNVKVVKNKVSPPYRTAKLELVYGRGISIESEILELGVQFGLIAKIGNWYECEGTKLGQGRENAKNSLRENPELALSLRQKIEAELKK
jgi:recombination protein RecA